MAIFSVYIVNKAGGLIYQHDHNASRPEVEKTFSYPLELVLKVFDDKIVVAFGERDGIKGRHSQSCCFGLATHSIYFHGKIICHNFSID
jgi:hypothetical protein